MPSLANIVDYCGLAVLQGVLVILPRPVAAATWGRMRSPGWAVILPGALMVGTFGVLDVPDGATGLALLAAVATPVLVAIAVLGVVRGRRAIWLAALPVLTAGVAVHHSWPSQLATTVLTALGCLTVGAALVRLTPLPWLAAGIGAMCVVDVVLLASGAGEPAAHRLELALKHSSLPQFHRAQLGSMNRDYPDLVLAAVLGCVLAGHARQRTAAVLVAALSCANGLFFLVADILPATVPVAVAATVVAALERRPVRRRRPAAAPARQRGARPGRPGVAAGRRVRSAEGR